MFGLYFAEQANSWKNYTRRALCPLAGVLCFLA
jgi:hypothetical protein